MLQDDYKKIMEYFEQTAQGKPLDLQELCSRSLQFFNNIHDFVEQGNDKEREEAMHLMSDMHKKLMEECKKLTANTGMTEEQLMAFAENSSNFNPEQWQLIQQTRETMAKTGTSLTEQLGHMKKEAPKPKPDKTKSPRKPKRDTWLKS